MSTEPNNKKLFRFVFCVSIFHLFYELLFTVCYKNIDPQQVAKSSLKHLVFHYREFENLCTVST